MGGGKAQGNEPTSRGHRCEFTGDDPSVASRRSGAAGVVEEQGGRVMTLPEQREFLLAIVWNKTVPMRFRWEAMCLLYGEHK